MDYEIARARILLYDLAHVERGQPPGVQFDRSDDRGAAIRGTASRLGLQRMAVRLGQAALTAQSVVVLHNGGGVSKNTAAAVAPVQVALVDDPPAATPPPPVDWPGA